MRKNSTHPLPVQTGGDCLFGKKQLTVDRDEPLFDKRWRAKKYTQLTAN